MNAPAFQSEQTALGEQSLVPGVRPIGPRERLEQRMKAPLVTTRAQKTLDIGLFDDAALNQLELFGPGGRLLPPSTSFRQQADGAARPSGAQNPAPPSLAKAVTGPKPSGKDDDR